MARTKCTARRSKVQRESNKHIQKLITFPNELFIYSKGGPITERHLKRIFGKYGTITNISIPTKKGRNRNYGFLSFKHKKESDFAIEKLNNKVIIPPHGVCPITVQYSITNQTLFGDNQNYIKNNKRERVQDIPDEYIPEDSDEENYVPSDSENEDDNKDDEEYAPRNTSKPRSPKTTNKRSKVVDKPRTVVVDLTEEPTEFKTTTSELESKLVDVEDVYDPKHQIHKLSSNSFFASKAIKHPGNCLVLDGKDIATSKCLNDSGFKGTIVVPNNTKSYFDINKSGICKAIPLSVQEYIEGNHDCPVFEFSSVYLDFCGTLKQLDGCERILISKKLKIFGFTLCKRGVEDSITKAHDWMKRHCSKIYKCIYENDYGTMFTLFFEIE